MTTDYELAIFHMDHERYLEERFRRSLPDDVRAEYDRHVKERNALLSSFTRAMQASTVPEATPYVAVVRETLDRVVGEGLFWRQRRVRFAERDCPPMIVRVPT